MKKFFLGSCVVLFFCFSNASAQQNQKVRNLLKRLRKATLNELKAMQGNEKSLSNLPKYSPEGEKLEDMELLQFFGPEKDGEYTADMYVGKRAEPKLLLIRKKTAEEKKMNREQKNMKKTSLKTKIEKAPTFNVKTIKGKSFNLEKLKGKIVVLNFWFINCPPCRQEISELNKIVEKYKDNEEVIFLSFARDNQKDIEKFLKKNPFYYHIVADADNIAKRYKLQGFPTNILIDKKGNIQVNRTGYNPYYLKELEKKIAENL